MAGTESRRIIRAKLCCLLAALLFCASCEERETYRIDLQADGDTLKRHLLCYRGDEEEAKPLAPDKILALESVYDEHVSDENRHRFTGVVRGQQNNGHGGSVVFQRLRSPLGDLYIYSERFAGGDNLSKTLERRLQAADRIAELIAAWLESVLASEERFDDLKRWCQTGLREDLRGIVVTLWADHLTAPYRDDTDTANEVGSRLLHYLSDRGYINLNEQTLMTLSRSLMEDDEGSSAAIWLFKQLIANKLGQQQPPSGLDSLDDLEQPPSSWIDILEGTPEYAALVADWERSREEDPETEKPEAADVVEGLLAEGGFSSEFGSGTPALNLDMRLSVPVKPEATNGSYDADQGVISWKNTIHDREWPSRLPTYSHATWVIPNERFQQSHLGRTLIDGDALVDFCVWFTGLSPDDTRQFQAFLETLKPESPHLERIAGFRFTGHAGLDDGDYLDSGSNVLTNALGREERLRPSGLSELTRSAEEGDAQAMNRLAWTLATSSSDDLRDGNLALEWAQRACEATSWQSANDIDTLAAAWAELEMWDNAVKTQQRALDALEQDSQATKQQSKAFRIRLERYERKEKTRH